MKTIIKISLIIYIFIGIPIYVSAQYLPNEYKENIDSLVSPELYKDLIQFVLQNGDTETYCSMYNNNPHYSFESTEVYLNSMKLIGFSDDLGEGEIESITLKMTIPRIFYIHLFLEAESVYLLPNWDTKETFAQKKDNLKIIMNTITEEIKFKK